MCPSLMKAEQLPYIYKSKFLQCTRLLLGGCFGGEGGMSLKPNTAVVCACCMDSTCKAWQGATLSHNVSTHGTFGCKANIAGCKTLSDVFSLRSRLILSQSPKI